MPRVLIVTYPWLPLFNVGVKHVATLCRYLPAADWEPHILTKDWTASAAPEDAALAMSEEPLEGTPSLVSAERLPVTRSTYGLRDNRWLRWHARLTAAPGAQRVLAPEAWARRALDLAYPRFGHHPDMHRGWVEPAVEAGLASVRQYGISAVVSVCPPATSHIVGGEIARRAGIPWVVLFADLAEFHQGPGDGRSSRVRWENRTRARRWLRGASRSACISPQMVDYVRETYHVDGDVVVMPFDPDERRVAPHRIPGAPMRIVHTGSIDPRVQQPALLFDVLDALIAAEPEALGDMVVELVGSRADDWLAETLQGRACEVIVRLIPLASPAELTRVRREADLQLTFNYQDAVAGRLSYPPTMFEHWNAGRPTVAVGPDVGGFVTELLATSRAGETVGDAAALLDVLRRLRAELRTTGVIAFGGDDAVIARYGAPEQAKRLGALIDAASGERFGSWVRARR